MKDVRKLVPRTPPEGLLEWAAGAKEELDEDVLLIETEWAEDFRLEVILDEWAQRKKVRAIRATCSACTESGLLWRSRDGRGDWGFLHPDSWTEGEGGRNAAEKREILERLRRYRQKHGLGCFEPLAEACGKGITPDLLRRLYSVDEVVPIQVWRQVGAGLGKLGVPKLDTNGG